MEAHQRPVSYVEKHHFVSEQTNTDDDLQAEDHRRASYNPNL